MKPSRSGSIPLLAAGLLAGCGSDSQVGGGGGIEIPNGLTLTVNAADNQPAKGVAVRLLARESWVKRTLDGSSSVLDSAVTDAQGRVELPVPKAEGYWIEASAGSMGVRLEGTGAGPRTAVLSPLSRLDGSLTGDRRAGLVVRLAGTPRTTVTDDSGRFRFDSLPQSSYAVVAQEAGSRKLSQLGGAVVGYQATSLVAEVSDTEAVVLDDFSDGDNVWALDDLFGLAFWWIAASGSDLESVFGIDGSWKAIQSDSTRRWMGISIDGAQLGDNPWAGLGLDLGPEGGVFPDFSEATAIRIRMRGQGTWNLEVFEARGDTSVTWTTPLAIDSNWTTLRIPTGDLVPLSGDPETWNARRRKIRKFVFQTAAGGRLDLGELAIEGGSLGDWAK